jgi:hypothetical protein
MSATRTIVIAAEVGLAVRAAGDIAEVIGACLGADGLLLEEGGLSGTFFDLRTGLAGELLQKLVNYRLRAAIVVADPAAHGERFDELVREHRRHPLVRIVPTRAEADAWLRS